MTNLSAETEGMTGGYQKPITIVEAIRNIDNRTFLLPAIQRKFVWSTVQICSLFDSLMRKYPINTMMFWDVTNAEVKNGQKFYAFLNDYCERFKETNDLVKTDAAFHSFKAVIDGQQRLTSIYIGLRGTYAYKTPRLWWPPSRDEQILPPRKLFLSLYPKLEDGQRVAGFDFRFLTSKEAERKTTGAKEHFFEVGKVLQLDSVDVPEQAKEQVILPYLMGLGLHEDEFAVQTLTRLYRLVRHDEVIHSYCETSQKIDHVLDIFIRTNGGGTPLSYSDLLMSFAVANWQGDARKAIDSLIDQIRQEMMFVVDRDWVLKACLVLTEADVRFQVANFTKLGVAKIESNWRQLHECLIETMRLVQRFGLKQSSLRAKNAVIPIAYYLYKQVWNDKPLYESINNLKQHREERQAIAKWLHTALLRGAFGGNPDGVLRRMRRIIRDNLDQRAFPLQKIVEAFNGRRGDLRFTEDNLNDILGIHYGDGRCRSVLSLLFPEVNENQALDVDHLHPVSAFNKQALAELDWLRLDAKLKEFYLNDENWNTIGNLHLLNSSQNRSKQDLSLHDWVNGGESGFTLADLLLEPGDSLTLEAFPAFIARRRSKLRDRLRAMLIMTPSGSPNGEAQQEFVSIEADDDA